MFSSVAQIVGLIEIESAESGEQFLTSLRTEGGSESDAADASLDRLFARLAGRLSPPSQTLPENSPPPVLPANRLAHCYSRSGTAILLDADLARLEADLAEATGQLRLKLLAAGACVVPR